MKILRVMVLLVLGTLIFGRLNQAAAYYQSMPADVVIGQQNFTADAVNQGGTANASTLNNPHGVYFDPVSKKLFISDYGNHRVLIYNSVPTSNNAPADVVIGQANFTSVSANQGGSAGPNTLNSPSRTLVINGKLLVADYLNHRVLIFNSIPTTNNASADVVIGQTNFTTVTANQGGTVATTGRNGYSGPWGLATDGKKLVVVDAGNRRALIYNSIPSTNNASADVVLGQSTFFTNVSNQGGIGANTLADVFGALYADGKLLIGDVGNFRALVWNGIPTTNKAPANVVIGQRDFVSNGNSGGSVTVRRPWDFAFDGQRLFITHDFTAIVSVRDYGVPTQNGSMWTYYFGTGGATPVTANNMWEPRGVAVGDGKLFVVDGLHNNRILIYNNVTAKPGISLTSGPTSIGNNKIRFEGSISTASPYTVRSVQYSLNGVSPVPAQPIQGNFDTSTENFFLEFDPTANPARDNSGNLIGGYTLQINGTNTNTDTTTGLFYFSPFNLAGTDETAFSNSSTPTFSFSVNQQREVMKQNLQKYQVMVRKVDDGEESWRTLIDAIPVDFATAKGNPENLQAGTYAGIATNNGVYETNDFKATYSAESSNIQVYSKTQNLNGIYEWKVVAVDVTGNAQESQNRTLYVNTSPLDSFSNNFPLTLSSISGVGNVNLSTYWPQAKKSYSAGATPTLSGIAYAGSTVTANFLDQACALKTPGAPTCLKTLTTTTDSSSRFKLGVPSSTLTSGKRYLTRVSVTQGQQYNQLPVFTLSP